MINQMKERENRYRTINDSCGTTDYWDIKHNQKKENRCMRYTCGRCRNKAINNKLNDIVKIAKDKKLFRHFVITISGNNIRKYLTPNNSFTYCNNKWNYFRYCYWYDSQYDFKNLTNKEKRQYKKKKGQRFSYIAFFRSQTSGYAHLHILVNKFIKKSWIERTLRKINLGWARITYVDIHRIKNYLSKYWYKEHEWFIPENKKHFSSSRDINILQYKPIIYQKNISYFVLKPQYDLLNPYWKVDSYYNQINNHIIETDWGKTTLGYPPDLGFMLSEFYNKNRCFEC